MRQIPTAIADSVPPEGSTHISVAWSIPSVLRDLGVDLAEALKAAGIHRHPFDSPESRIEYREFNRLVAACAQLTNCDHFGMLVGQRTGLADLGLAGRSALCGTTADEGLRNLARHFNLHSSATTVSLVTSGGYARLIWAISITGITDARQMQFGALAVARNVLQELCGPQWRPTVVTIAARAPGNVHPLVRFFRAPLRFDSDESAVIFEERWLDRPLPPVPAGLRRQTAAEIRAGQSAVRANFPATVRRVVRKQIIVGQSSMNDIAAIFGVHRRTLDRHLQEHGVHFSELLEEVKLDIAQLLLGDTRMPVQQVAESLRFSSAANFATAFRHWTGMTPSEYRRRQDTSAGTPRR
ncbi:MAG: AraC family transcriptional regulator [Lysobacterales bacterium]|nr:MAG: AraC family transcriptional regulator [Xanthomonadales bacterium]